MTELNASAGVMLVGHGTRDELGTRQFLELGERLAEQLSPMPVRSCLLEFQHPTIPEAWRALMELGVQHIHVAPLLLFAAGHAKSDIPDVVGQCQAHAPEITLNQTRPLSRHPAIIDLVCRRITETENQAADSRARTALIMVGRGSHDPCAQADMRILTEIVNRQLAFAGSYTSFYAMAEPKLPAVIDRVASTGRYDSIIVQPHLLFAGRLYDAIENQTQDARQRHPGIAIHLSAYLGPDPLVAQAIASRISAML